jgi:hypothetical protein
MDEKYSHLFFTLVYSFQMQAMMGLGKIQNPVTNKTEVDLDAARMSIDMLEMLGEISKGNISENENKFLQETLTNLRLNFLDEQNKKPEDNISEDKKDKTE